MSGLTTHVLDTARGCPAEAMTVELWAREAGGARLLKRLVTNPEGRTDVPLLSGEEIHAGRYRLVFHVGAYLRRGGATAPLFDEVPVDFMIEDCGQHFHVPLLVSPFAYSTYRGS